MPGRKSNFDSITEHYPWALNGKSVQFTSCHAPAFAQPWTARESQGNSDSCWSHCSIRLLMIGSVRRSLQPVTQQLDFKLFGSQVSAWNFIEFSGKKIHHQSKEIQDDSETLQVIRLLLFMKKQKLVWMSWDMTFPWSTFRGLQMVFTFRFDIEHQGIGWWVGECPIRGTRGVCWNGGFEGS